MRVTIAYRPERMLYEFYLHDDHCAIYERDGQRLIAVLKPGDEMPVFLKLSEEDYRAIKEAIMYREAPMLADKNFLMTALERERETTDRLLTLVEQGWAG